MHRLEGEEALKKPLRVSPSRLPLESLKEAPEVFQPRDLARDTAAKEQHVRTLVNAIYSEPRNRLDPITVWWSGQDWYVIDGHHRKRAYEQVQQFGKVKIDSVPVREFQGSLIEAICEATKRNSKDKLAMTQEDKSNRAWLLVAMGKNLSKRQIATVCKISVPTVSRMRKRLQEIREAYPEDWQEEVTTMTWQEAQKFGKEKLLYNEDWEDAQAKEWAKRLAKAFGNKPVGQPEVFWRAVEAYSPTLAEQLSKFVTPAPDEFLEGEPDF
jgi:nucleotide-binding universal stress UspA family protein